MRYALVLVFVLVLFACGRKQVSFHDQILPILTSHCSQCHGGDRPRGKIDLTTYETFMKSRTISGKEPLVYPGSPYQSRLYILCETSQVHFRMPPDTSSVAPLTDEQLELLRHWIMEGAKDN